jgi:hypothetical protein
MRKQKTNYELIKTIEEFNKAVSNENEYFKQMADVVFTTKKAAEAAAYPNKAFLEALRAAATDAAMLLKMEMAHKAKGEVA